MKIISVRRIVPLILSASMVMSWVTVFAEDEVRAEMHCAGYYNEEGALIGAKLIKGVLSDDEVDTLVDIYEPNNTAKAEVYDLTKELEPISYDPREVEMDSADVVVLHTNDMHGALAGSDTVIGSDSVAALKKLDNAILVDGGDATQGIALASQSKGEDVITIMNVAGYDVMAVGNHEFDYGTTHFAKLLDEADFPIISANTYVGDKLLCEEPGNDGANVIIEKNGIKVGFFALTTGSTKTATKPENISGVEFKDEVETAKAQTKALDEQGADVIIAITHMGVMEGASYTSRELANAMAGTELDAIIDGHSHTVVNEKVGDITIAQTGTGSVNLGRMAIDVEADGSVEIEETMLSRAFFDNIKPDANVTSVIEDISSELDHKLKAEIGETENTLWGGSIRGVIAEGRTGETNFGSLICDAMISEAINILPPEYKDSKGASKVPVVAIENGGGYRESVPNGKITLGHIINALPFSNTVRIKEITPAILYAVLEDCLSAVTAQDKETGFLTSGYSGSFPQVGGMRISYDPNKPAGSKIESITLIDSGKALSRNDNATKLIVASNDYVIEQGALGDIHMTAEGSGLTEVVIDYINALTANGAKPLEIPTSTGRIVTTAHNVDYTYTAHISLLNAGALKNGAEVNIYVDGSPYDKAGVVNNGVLDVKLPDGPHAVKLYPEQNEVYVNNYSGNGIIDVYGSLTLGYPELEYEG